MKNTKIKTKDEVAFEKYALALGKKLRKIRLKKGWTLEECEEKGYPNFRHLGEIERGEKNLSLFTLLRLSRLYKLKPELLLKDIKLK